MYREFKKSLLLKLLLITTLVFMLFTLSACFKSSSKKSIKVEKQYKVEKSLKLGDIKKTGYLLDVNPNTFESDGKLSLEVLSEEDSKQYENDDFTFYNNPLKLVYEDIDNVRLDTPAVLTVNLPSDIVVSELFFANYYDGKWEYLMPDEIDFQNNTVSIFVNHFSFWGFGKLSESEQIKNFSENIASLQWQQSRIKDELHKALDRQFNDLFESMGVSDGSIRNKLSLDMIEYLENEIFDPNSELGLVAPISTLANMANAIDNKQSGKEDFQNILFEMFGKALYRTIQKDPAEFSTLAGVTGGLSKAAGAMMEGDTKAALEGISDALRSNFIVRVADDLLTYVKETGEYAVELWTKNEIEKAYKIYTGKAVGKYGYDSDLEGNFEEVFMALAGGQRMMEINIVKKYCAKYNIDEATLGDKMRKKIVKNAYNYL